MSAPVPTTREEAWKAQCESRGYSEKLSSYVQHERHKFDVTWDAAYAAGLRRAAEIARALNDDYRDGDGLTGQRGFSVELRAAILAECSEGSK